MLHAHGSTISAPLVYLHTPATTGFWLSAPMQSRDEDNSVILLYFCLQLSTAIAEIRLDERCELRFKIAWRTHACWRMIVKVWMHKVKIKTWAPSQHHLWAPKSQDAWNRTESQDTSSLLTSSIWKTSNALASDLKGIWTRKTADLWAGFYTMDFMQEVHSHSLVFHKEFWSLSEEIFFGPKYHVWCSDL